MVRVHQGPPLTPKYTKVIFIFMGLINRKEIMGLRKKHLTSEILKLKSDKTQDSKLRIQKLQQQLDMIQDGKH